MKLRLYTLVLALFALASCSKELKVNGGTPTFDVQVDPKTTFKVGEDVIFNFTGKADIISFFSGELYREYSFKDGRVLDITNPIMSFTSAVSGGTQNNQMTILASTDFNGVYNDTLKTPLTDIHAATWTDITSRFTLGTSATFLASGSKSLSDLVVNGKPLYIAFKYITKPQGVNGAARTWMIQTFSLTGTASVGTLTLADMTSSGFRVIDGNSATAPTLSAVIPSRVTLQGNAFTPANDPTTEVWAISKAFNTGKVDNGPDYPVAIKGFANPTMTSYNYKYTKAGTYKVYFIAINANAEDKKQVVKEVDVTIVP